mgnify:FL=1
MLPLLSPSESAELDTLLTERDPLARLMDPSFSAVSWEYEYSRTDTLIPGTLHSKQLAALSSQAKHRWLFWGNQVGKTTLGAVDLVLLCLGRHPYLQRWQPPITAWASALTWELWQKILLPELLTWIPKDRILDAPQPHQQSTKRDILIRADNGRISRITGKAAEQGADKYQSARVHAVWLDEEHPEAVWDEMQPRLLRHGGITLATMTPLKGLTWVYHRYYEPWRAGTLDPAMHFVSHAGLSDNPVVKPEEIQAITAELQHNPAQLAARLHGKFVRPTGLVLPFNPDTCYSDITPNHVNQWRRHGQAKSYAAIDFGLWRFAFGVAIEDPEGGLVLVEECFSQRESLEARAKKVSGLMNKWGMAPDTLIVGDCANPQDILELNLAFQRLKSPYQVAGIDAEKKIVRVGIERIENLMNRGAFRVRRGIGDGQTWYLGMNSARQGKPIMGSRWLWEVNNWLYPNDDTGKAQKDVPDDNSADGADMMAMSRYLVMSWWEKQKVREDRRHWDQHPGFNPVTHRPNDDRSDMPMPAYQIPEYRLPRWGD